MHYLVNKDIILEVNQNIKFCFFQKCFIQFVYNFLVFNTRKVTGVIFIINLKAKNCLESSVYAKTEHEKHSIKMYLMS